MKSAVSHANWASVDDPDYHAEFEREIARQLDLVQGEPNGIPSPADVTVFHSGATSRTTDQLDDDIRASTRAQADWRRLPWQQRVEILRRLIPLVERETASIAASLSIQVGKNRFEGATEVAEAIALINCYCDDMVTHHGFEVALESTADTSNRTVLRPYGTFAVFSPFNFPFALLVGSTVAALLMGNGAILKAPDQAPFAGTKLLALLEEAGIPAGLVGLCDGGPEGGRRLVEHPSIAGTAFTGSDRVGRIIRETMDGRPCIAELGGKNATIVASSADVAVAAVAIARSAFRYAGQKCSATSVVYAADSVIDELVEKLRVEAGRMLVGVPWLKDTVVGPLIDDKAVRRYEEALIEAVHDAGTVHRAIAADQIPAGGNYVSPAIVVGLPQTSRLVKDELFAPILCVQPVPDVAAAIAHANDTPYGLTAAIYSRDESDIAAFLDRIDAGVAYINRPEGSTTGAWVGQQSFGGWKNSGSTGKNAHGPYYLAQYGREQSQSRHITG